MGQHFQDVFSIDKFKRSNRRKISRKQLLFFDKIPLDTRRQSENGKKISRQMPMFSLLIFFFREHVLNRLV